MPPAALAIPTCAFDVALKKPPDAVPILPTSVPDGWPRHLDHPLAWRGSDFVTEHQYIYGFTNDEKIEIHNALAHFKSLELDGSEVTQSTFPLPTLAEKLHQLSVDLHDGKGFCVLRGLDPKTYSPEENVLIYLGLSSYIAETRGKQDEEGIHIREAKEMVAPQADRPARDSNTRLAFHTDQFPDILALQTRGCAEVGGNHNIASSYGIYNELATTRPDILRTLAAPDWYFDSRSLFVQPERRALLFNHGGHIILNFGRIHLMATEPADDGSFAPKPTNAQVEALDVVQQLADKHKLSLSMVPGDIAFINNLGILHARDEFVDTPDNTRYLVRMWLKNKAKAWSLPRTLERGNARTYDETAEEIWNIRPAPRVTFKIGNKDGSYAEGVDIVKSIDLDNPGALIDPNEGTNPNPSWWNTWDRSEMPNPAITLDNQSNTEAASDDGVIMAVAKDTTEVELHLQRHEKTTVNHAANQQAVPFELQQSAYVGESVRSGTYWQQCTNEKMHEPHKGSNTPFYIAASSGNSEVIAAMISYGGNFYDISQPVDEQLGRQELLTHDGRYWPLQGFFNGSFIRRSRGQTLFPYEQTLLYAEFPQLDGTVAERENFTASSHSKRQNNEVFRILHWLKAVKGVDTIIKLKVPDQLVNPHDELQMAKMMEMFRVEFLDWKVLDFQYAHRFSSEGIPTLRRVLPQQLEKLEIKVIQDTCVRERCQSLIREIHTIFMKCKQAWTRENDPRPLQIGKAGPVTWYPTQKLANLSEVVHDEGSRIETAYPASYRTVARSLITLAAYDKFRTILREYYGIIHDYLINGEDVAAGVVFFLNSEDTITGSSVAIAIAAGLSSILTCDRLSNEGHATR
ncbi:hypothetical protein NUW58_g1242 [Xylaria curta]|uniref:Uncharacterized protein n=1 Tax=Xylaria curta TaxID=42375 RepID=A0ACC1PPE8_9PEZI|nr:hypothetical protein NUW58_g1242 [Xylaria curta]